MWPPSSTSPSTCAGRPWACSPCSATKEAVSARRWSRLSRSGAINSTPLERGVPRPLHPEASSFLKQTRAFFYEHTGDPAGSQQIALQVLADLRRLQAASFAYFDVFWVAAVASLGLVFLVFLMKRSVAETNPSP